MGSPLVDIIIPCYNMTTYLSQAIDSALAQTYAHVRVVVVDDGSTEDIRSLVELYAGRVNYIRQENRGQAAARNTGIAHTDGDFVCFLDADDIILPGKTAIQTTFLNAHPDVDLVHGRALTFVDNNVYLPCAETRPYETWEDYLEPLSIFCAFPIHSALMRRDSFLRYGGFAEFMRGRCEDWAFWFNCVQNGAKFVYQPEVVCLYRQHVGSESAGIKRYARNEYFWMPLLLESYLNSGMLSLERRNLLICGIRFIATKQLEIGEKNCFKQLNSLAANLVTVENTADSNGIFLSNACYPSSVYYLQSAKDIADLGFPQLAGFVFLHAGDSRLLRYDAARHGFIDVFYSLVAMFEKYLNDNFTVFFTDYIYEFKSLKRSGDTGSEPLHTLEDLLPSDTSFASYLYHQLGLLAQIDGAHAKSIEYFKMAVQLNPYFSEHQEYLLRALDKFGDQAESSGFLEKFLISNENSVHVLYHFAKLQIRQLKIIEAFNGFRKAFMTSRLHFFRNIYLDIEHFLLRKLGIRVWRFYKLTVKALIAR